MKLYLNAILKYLSPNCVLTELGLNKKKILAQQRAQDETNQLATGNNMIYFVMQHQWSKINISFMIKTN